MPTFKRRVLQLLEREGAHRLLAKSATYFARRVTGHDVELFFDDIWIRRVGNNFYGDKDSFDYYVGEFEVWNELHQLWEQDPVDFWLYDYRPQPGDVVVDIGAGFGNDAIVFSRAIGPDGKVFSIEAHPMSYRKLVKTCKWSKLDNVIPIEAAIDGDNGTVVISDDENDVDNSIGGFNKNSESTFEVKAYRLDTLASELGIEKIDLLKMNIEGAERGALAGMKETLSRIRHVAIACHDFRTLRGESEFFRTKDSVRKTLVDAGFKLKERTDDPRPYVADTVYGVR